MREYSHKPRESYSTEISVEGPAHLIEVVQMVQVIFY